ncbi:probable ATP-dependent helicase PF08_0048 [Athalia rosae]|uniref:probable ATP-dependent helicase PF08_0048 n=1 Tax=Athalia rosae TaxID=37344 RepID=UPI002033576C|nr:probable ATP-dependent helicase PF08_0048 [Athalia rosae]
MNGNDKKDGEDDEIEENDEHDTNQAITKNYHEIDENDKNNHDSKIDKDSELSEDRKTYGNGQLNENDMKDENREIDGNDGDYGNRGIDGFLNYDIDRDREIDGNCKIAGNYGNERSRQIDKDDEIDKNYENNENCQFDENSEIGRDRGTDRNESGPAKTKSDKEFYHNLITAKAKDCFIAGLNEKMRDMLRIRNPKDLIKAYQIASYEERLKITEDRISQFSKSVTLDRSKITCQHCDKTGHSMKNCFKLGKNQKPEAINACTNDECDEYEEPFEPDSQEINYCSQNCSELINECCITEEITCDECHRVYPVDSNRLACFFCKKPGHVQANCFKRRAMLASKPTPNNANQQPNFVNRTALVSGTRSMVGETRSTQTTKD